MMPPSATASPDSGPNGPSDEALMAALASGDFTALDALMLRWRRPLLGFLQRHLRHEADALDLAQETFVRVYQHRVRYRPGARFSTWMFQIALNLARDHGRKVARRRTDSLDALVSPGSAGSAPMVPAQFAGDGASPAEAAHHTEETLAVRAALAALPEDLRAVVIFSEYDDLSHAEIAARVGATSKAVETRLRRAREKLRASLGPWLRT